MDRTEYDAKSRLSSLRGPIYRKLPRDPTPALECKVNNKLLSLRKKEVLSQTLYRQLRSSLGICPIIFGQPKIHKPDVPLRPIVSTRGSPTYSLPTPGFDPQTSCWQLWTPCGKLHRLHWPNPRLGHSEHWNPISFDVVSLFTSVTVKDSCQILHKCLQADDTLKDRTEMYPRTDTRTAVTVPQFYFFQVERHILSANRRCSYGFPPFTHSS